jgi:hypothetical protein
VVLKRTDASEQYIASIISVKRISEPGTNYSVSVVPSSLILFNLIMEGIFSSETSVLTKPTLHDILKKLHSSVTAVKASNLT